MNAERLMRFTLVLVVLTLVALVVFHESAPPTPAPESAANLDWLDNEEESVIEIGVPPETEPELPAWITDDTPAPPPPETPVEAPPRELLERARAEGREEARRAVTMGSPVLIGAGYRGAQSRSSDPVTGLPIGTIGDDLDPYQIAFIDAYNREIHRLVGTSRRDLPPEVLRSELEHRLRMIQLFDAEQFTGGMAEGESPDGIVLAAHASMVVVDLNEKDDGFLEGTRLMVWKGHRRIALIEAFPNSRVCRIVYLFDNIRVAEGMTVSSPFFERNRSLRVALDHPGESTDVRAVRDRLLMMGARLVPSVKEADVVVRLDPYVTPVPGKLVVGAKALRTFLDLRP